MIFSKISRYFRISIKRNKVIGLSDEKFNQLLMSWLYYIWLILFSILAYSLKENFTKVPFVVYTVLVSSFLFHLISVLVLSIKNERIDLFLYKLKLIKNNRQT